MLHKKCIKMSTNKLNIGLVILEMSPEILRKHCESATFPARSSMQSKTDQCLSLSYLKTKNQSKCIFSQRMTLTNTTCLLRTESLKSGSF